MVPAEEDDLPLLADPIPELADVRTRIDRVDRHDPAPIYEDEPTDESDESRLGSVDLNFGAYTPGFDALPEREDLELANVQVEERGCRSPPNFGHVLNLDALPILSRTVTIPYLFNGFLASFDQFASYDRIIPQLFEASPIHEVPRVGGRTAVLVTMVSNGGSGRPYFAAEAGAGQPSFLRTRNAQNEGCKGDSHCIPPTFSFSSRLLNLVSGSSGFVSCETFHLKGGVGVQSRLSF